MSTHDTTTYSPEAEQTVLAAILADPSILGVVSDRLTANDFADPAHQSIYSAMQLLSETGKVIEVGAVATAMRERKLLDRAGGVAYLLELAEVVAPTLSVEQYADTIRRDSTRRLFRIAAVKAADRCSDYGEDPEEIIAKLEADAASLRGATGVLDTEIGFAVAEAVKLLDQASKSGGINGVTTGLSYVDWITGGMHGSDLIILAARPGVGKSALASGVLEAAARSGAPAALLGLEMHRREYARRMLCQLAEVPQAVVRTGLNKEQEKRLALAATELSQLPIHIVSDGVRSMREIRSTIRMLVRKHGVKLVVLDYLQLIVDESDRSRNDDVAKMTRGLKSLAKELDIPILCLSQLNRGLEQRADKRPILSDLRDSGAIEQDADSVWFLYREAYHAGLNRVKAAGQYESAEIIVAKQRNGATGSGALYWEAGLTRFISPHTTGFAPEGVQHD